MMALSPEDKAKLRVHPEDADGRDVIDLLDEIEVWRAEAHRLKAENQLLQGRMDGEDVPL